MVVKLVDALTETKRPVDMRLFENVFLAKHTPKGSFLASALGHVLCILILPVLADYLPPANSAADFKQAYTLRPLNIRVPKLLYLPSAGAPKPKPAARPKPAPRRENAENTAPSKPAPRRFELPNIPSRADRVQTVLQPQYPLDVSPPENLRLPNAFFWGATDPKVPRPKPKDFVVPGHTQTATATPRLDAPPKLELPNREIATTGLKMANAAMTLNPALPVPPGNSMPVRVFTPPSPRQPEQGVALDPFPGDPSNLLTISPNAPPLTKSFSVPAGNQLGYLPGPPPDPSMGSLGGIDGDSGTGGGGTGTGDSSTTGDGGIPGGTGTGESGTGGPGSSGTGTSGSGSSLRASSAMPGGLVILGSENAGQGGARAIGSPPNNVVLTSPDGLRMVHPNNGVFDVVVVQSSPTFSLPESPGILSGKPIYSVYLQVGTRREWIMQYCIPAGSVPPPRLEGEEYVHLGGPSTLRAPYALVTYTPAIALESRSGQILIHGFLDDRGKFSGLEMLTDKKTDLGDRVIPYLEKWEFRPATKDGYPVRVEVLLQIPPSSQ